MPYINMTDLYHIRKGNLDSLENSCFYKWEFNHNCNGKTRQIICTCKCACSSNKIICIIHFTAPGYNSEFCLTANFRRFCNYSMKKCAKTKSIFNKFICFYIFSSILILQWFLLVPVPLGGSFMLGTSLSEYHEDEAVTQKSSKHFQCIREKKMIRPYFTCSNSARIWDRNINNADYALSD